MGIAMHCRNCRNFLGLETDGQKSPRAHGPRAWRSANERQIRQGKWTLVHGSNVVEHAIRRLEEGFVSSWALFTFSAKNAAAISELFTESHKTRIDRPKWPTKVGASLWHIAKEELEKMDLDQFYDTHLEHELYKEPQWQRALPLFRLMFSPAIVDVLSK